MELNELIGNVLKELQKAKRHEEKKNYLVDEVTLEIAVSSIAKGKGGLDLTLWGAGVKLEGGGERENGHKIIIKLKPKSGAKLSSSRPRPTQ